jgi:hypothetical protein
MPVVTVDQGQSSVAVAGRTIQYLTALAAQQLPGAPDSLIQSQLYLVLRHFYTESTGWRTTLGPFPVSAGVAGQNIYLNPVDQDTQLQYVLQVYLYPAPNTGSNTRQFLQPSTQPVVSNVPGPPSSYFMYTPDQIQIQPLADKSYGNILYVIASLCPTISAINLPDSAFTHYLDDILAGLFARMYRMPDKPWTDVEGARMYEKQYKRGVLTARDFAIRGNSAADVPWVFPSFATSRTLGANNGGVPWGSR